MYSSSYASLDTTEKGVKFYRGKSVATDTGIGVAVFRFFMYVPGQWDPLNVLILCKILSMFGLIERLIIYFREEDDPPTGFLLVRTTER